MEWKVADAKNRFSELLDTVDELGAQEIHRRGKVYILSPQPVDNGAGNRLVEIFRNGPSWDEVTVERLPGKMRDVEL